MVGSKNLGKSKIDFENFEINLEKPEIYLKTFEIELENLKFIWKYLKKMCRSKRERDFQTQNIKEHKNDDEAK